MASKRSPKNPFYVLLVVLGIAFALTACAYSVMTLKAVRQAEDAAPAGGARLLEFLDEHGALLMAVELVLLAITTVAAISTDRYWMQRAYDEHQAGQASRPQEESPDTRET